jgi:hypothetical protein
MPDDSNNFYSPPTPFTQQPQGLSGLIGSSPSNLQLQNILGLLAQVNQGGSPNNTAGSVIPNTFGGPGQATNAQPAGPYTAQPPMTQMPSAGPSMNSGPQASGGLAGLLGMLKNLPPGVLQALMGSQQMPMQQGPVTNMGIRG